LDIIEYFWDGKNTFYEYNVKNDLFLLEELNTDEKIIDHFYKENLLFELIEKVEPIIKSRIFIFSIPYSHQNNYTLTHAFPGTVLILYANAGLDSKTLFLEGIGQFYLKEQLKQRLPHWAQNEKAFLQEFVKWGLNQPSKFKK
jgi:hypothetical protein